MYDDIGRIDVRGTTFATALVVLAGGLLVLAQPAAAQQGQQGPPAAQDIEVSEAELETFAEAHLDVQEIRAEMEKEIQSAENTESARAVQKQANQEMAAVIEDEHEMEVERYRNISRAINQDPELQKQFRAILEELTEDDEEGGGSG